WINRTGCPRSRVWDLGNGESKGTFHGGRPVLPDHLELLPWQIADRAALVFFRALRRIAADRANVKVLCRADPAILLALFQQRKGLAVEARVGLLRLQSPMEG